MTQSTKVNITSPVGRIVAGSLYKASTTDADGKPLTFKSGPNAGQPRVNFYFGLAIPKIAGHTHWGQTDWGLKIWNAGNTAFPNIAQSPSFAWKITDGDSAVPNKRGNKPCENEGWRGNWVLRLSGGYAPKVYRQEGTGYVQIMEAEAVKPGHFIEAFFTVDGNNSNQTPGVYLNHSMVCFRAYGPEINFGPDVAAAGFGAAPLPAGASAVPLAGSAPPPLPPGGFAPPHQLPVAGAPALPQIPVTPNQQFLQVPPPAGFPAPGSAPAGPGFPSSTPTAPGSPFATTVATFPSSPPAAPARVMTALAKGITYEAYIAAGWTDAVLVQHGMMLA